MMSSDSDFITKREPLEGSETADHFAHHRVYDTNLTNQVHALTSAPMQPLYETVPFDGNRNISTSADECPDANGQSCTSPDRGDSSKEVEQASQEYFLSNCKAWEKWYNVKQRDGQSVLQFAEHLQKVAASLPGHGSRQPSLVEQFHRLRSSLRDPIKTILDAQIIQPTTYDDLVSAALRIEEKEMILLGHTTVSRRKPLVPVPASKPPKKIQSSYRPKPCHNGYTSLQRAKAALEHRAGALGPLPSKIKKHSKRKSHKIGIQRSHGLPVDQVSTRDKNANHCYVCGKSNHIPSECQEGSKFFEALSFPVRPKVLENSLMPNSQWNL